MNNSMNMMNTSMNADMDRDGVVDSRDRCRNGVRGWTSSSTTDNDRDGCRDSDEDIDVDGDGLIELNTALQLNMMRNNLTGTGLSNTSGMVGNQSGCGGQANITACNGYELTANIDLNDLEDNISLANWERVGFCLNNLCDRAVPFRANFNGNGYNISNMRIISDNVLGIGFFGAVHGNFNISNTHLTNASLQSTNGVLIGVLVGNLKNATIISSSVYAQSVNLDGGGIGYIGGLVGHLSGNIIASYVLAQRVNSTAFSSGGLVGVVDVGQSRIIASTAIVANISSNRFNAGGLIGWLNSNTDVEISITSSYAANYNVSTTSIQSAAGFLGARGNSGVNDDSLVIINNSYSLSSNIMGGYSNHPFIGGDSNPTNTSNSYYDNTINSLIGPAVLSFATNRGEGKSMSELQSPTSAAGIYSTYTNKCPNNSSIDIWNFGTNSEYPVINCFGSRFTPAMQRAAITEALAGRDPTTVFR